MQKDQLINFDLSVGSYSSFVSDIIDLAKKKSSSYVCIANVHMFVEAHWDKSFCKVVREADIVTPDGKPLTWGLRLLNGIKQDRVAGGDISDDLLQQCEQQNLSVFFYGGSQKLLDGTSDFLKKKYPNLKAGRFIQPAIQATERRRKAGCGFKNK